MLYSNSKITKTQQQELQQLIAACQPIDQGLPAIYHHLIEEERHDNKNFFYYHDERLIGFLSVYIFYANGSEISLLVHPNHRRQGTARRLLQAALPLLEQNNSQNLIFSRPPSLEMDKWLFALGFKYYQSEFYMERDSLEPILLPSSFLTVKKAKVDDAMTLYHIDELCFTNHNFSTPERLATLIQNHQYTIFVVEKNKQLIGKAHIRWDLENAFISDIAIHPNEQKQGYGSALLSFCINHILEQGRRLASLNVITTNTHALSLYQRQGFKTIRMYEYWITSLDNLKNLLKTAS